MERLAPLAQEQWGLVTRRQIEAAGVSQATVARLVAGGSTLERVASGVYHLAGAPWPDHAELRAAWLQLAPDVPSWERQPISGVVSHRSAASLFGIGELPADSHDFIVGARQQTRRRDVNLHTRALAESEWVKLRGLPVTRPSRIAADLLRDREDPEAVARIVGDALRHVHEDPASFAVALGPLATRYGHAKGDGLGVLAWLLDLAGDPESGLWMSQARAAVPR